MNVLHQREDRVTTLYDVVDEKDQDTPKVLKVLYTKNPDTNRADISRSSFPIILFPPTV